MTLWGGRFSGKFDARAARLNSSLAFDRRLAAQDARASTAWAHALARAGVLSSQEADQIAGSLQEIQKEIETASFAFKEADEDIHTAIERRLTEKLGPLGAKLHSGRSRNDQVATDFRLWVAERSGEVDRALWELQQTLLQRAERDRGVVIPGYTHLQQAQPVLLSHWWLSHFWPLSRDRDRLKEARERVLVMPLGSGALAGTSFPIDREALARELGFRAPSPNSLDAVSDRDFAVEFLFAAALIGVHLSSLAEMLILFSTSEFGFVSLAEEYSTGSSLMPQKRNPDPLELVRAKSGVLLGDLVALLAVLKGLPSGYNKDLQEDKPAVFHAADTLELVLPAVTGAVATLQVRPDRVRAALDPASFATDLADYLVERGVPFRQAHKLVGMAVRRAEELGLALPDLPYPEWQALHPSFAEDLFQVFDVGRALARRAAWGGTAPEAVEKQLQLAKEKLAG